MNVFMILIMAAMLGIYQYFTAKKSSDVTLNKEELAFEAELNCLKQFHDYGAAKNEATLQEGLLNPGYTCAGSENIKLAKYFIKNDQTISEHCVATTSSKEKLDNSLKALLFKKGIEEIKNGPTIKGIKISSLNHTASTSTTTSFGLVSCVPAKQIEEREKMAGEDCAKKGKFATRTPSGEFICTDVPEVTGCTAHEEERPASGINCTSVGNEKYCCPKNPSNICGNDTNIKAVWNTSSRFYNCVNGEETCNKGSKSMQVVDENNIKGKYSNTASVDKFYIAKYNTTNRQWDCIPNAELLIKTCKEAVAKNNLAYVSVTDISKANATPVCQGASSKSASAVETCSACGIPTLDKETQQWKCQYPTISTDGRQIISFPNGLNRIDYINIVKLNSKGVEPCFKGCNGTTTSGTSYITEIQEHGRYNGINWGLAWNSNSKLFECFQCGERTSAGGTLTYAQSYINSNCKENPNADSQTTSSCNAENNLHKDTDCKNRTTYINGKCVLRCCNELYRKRGTDGKCYTKWCRGIPAEANATTGKPAENECPESHPRLLYHETKDCVYCIKTPPFSIVETQEESSN